MLWSGFEADHRKQYLPIPITDTNLFKAIFLSCRFIVMIQSRFLDIYSVPEFHFENGGNSPLRWLLWEDFFYLRGEGGHFFFFKNIHLSHLNVWSSSAFLFLQLCNCCRKAYTQHKPDFTQESTTDPSVYHKHNIYPLFWFQIQTLLLKMLFHCDSFCFYSNTIFTDV